MKLLYIITSFFIYTLGNRADIPYSSIEAAFLKSNAMAISEMGNDKLTVSLFNKENVYSNNQVALVLKDFFVKYPVSSFKFIFKGKETQDGIFAIANYQSKNSTIRITFHFKKNESAYKIIRLNFEQE